jgi:predicted Zn-dependent protease
MKHRNMMIASALAIVLAAGVAGAQDWGKIAGSAIGGIQQMAEASKEITPSEEHYIGRAVAAMVFERYPLLDNPALNSYLNKVGLMVAYQSDRPVTYGGYHFAVLASDDINAFACPGGIILVTRGLLRTVENEDQLANVLGHEVTHVAKRHGIGAIKKSRWTKFGFYAAGEIGKHYTPSEVSELVGEFQGVVTDVAKQVIENGYSKGDEAEADELGMRYAAAAGYSPKAMADFINVEIAKGLGSKSGPYSSHPSPEVRLKKVEGELGKMGSPGEVAKVRTARYQGAVASLK